MAENMDYGHPTDPMLKIDEIAAELRCSKAHVSNLIRGKVRGVEPLPAIQLGRRKVVRRSKFEAWKARNEKVAG